MSLDLLSNAKVEDVPPSGIPLSRHLASLLLDVGTSPLVLKGDMPGHLTQAEADGLLKFINAPLSDEEFDEMDQESAHYARLPKSVIYIVLILLFEARWSTKDIAQVFGMSSSSISSIRHMKQWVGTFKRYARDRNLDPYELANPVKNYRSLRT